MERIITGLHGIEEALKAGKKSGKLYVCRKNARIDDIRRGALQAGVEIINIPPSEMNKRFGESRGTVLQLFESGNLRREVGSGAKAAPAGKTAAEGSFEERIDSLSGENPLVMILDGVTDPHNYGAILRSAEQFGVDLVVTRERRSASENDTVARTSSGAVNYVDTAVVKNLNRAAEYLKERGFWVYSADMGGEAVYNTDMRGRTAIVMGSEGKGVSRLLAEKCDAVVSIPSSGRIDSLNVSVAAGILLYEIRRQQAGA